MFKVQYLVFIDRLTLILEKKLDSAFRKEDDKGKQGEENTDKVYKTMHYKITRSFNSANPGTVQQLRRYTATRYTDERASDPK